jgi:hypothetical protein
MSPLGTGSTQPPTTSPGPDVSQATTTPPQCTPGEGTDPAGQHGTIEDARRVAFSILVNGADSAETASLFLWNDIILPSKSTFYRAQGTLLLPITDQCLLNCQRFGEEMLPGSIVAFDGSWSHPPGAKECIVVFVDCRTKKIVDFEIM